MSLSATDLQLWQTVFAASPLKTIAFPLSYDKIEKTLTGNSRFQHCKINLDVELSVLQGKLGTRPVISNCRRLSDSQVIFLSESHSSKKVDISNSLMMRVFEAGNVLVESRNKVEAQIRRNTVNSYFPSKYSKFEAWDTNVSVNFKGNKVDLETWMQWFLASNYLMENDPKYRDSKKALADRKILSSLGLQMQPLRQKNLIDQFSHKLDEKQRVIVEAGDGHFFIQASAKLKIEDQLRSKLDETKVKYVFIGLPPRLREKRILKINSEDMVQSRP